MLLLRFIFSSLFRLLLVTAPGSLVLKGSSQHFHQKRVVAGTCFSCYYYFGKRFQQSSQIDPCQPFLINNNCFYICHRVFSLFIYPVFQNQNLNPKFRLGSHLYFGAPFSIAAKAAGKFVLTGQYLRA